MLAAAKRRACHLLPNRCTTRCLRTSRPPALMRNRHALYHLHEYSLTPAPARIYSERSSRPAVQPSARQHTTSFPGPSSKLQHRAGSQNETPPRHGSRALGRPPRAGSPRGPRPRAARDGGARRRLGRALRGRHGARGQHARREDQRQALACVEIKFRAPHAIDATLSPWPRRLDSVEVT